MRNSFSALLLLTIMLFFSISVTAQQDSMPPTANGSISGRVTASDGVTPISGAEIYVLTGDPTSFTTVLAVASAGDGTYSVSVPPGSYSLSARKQGYVAQYYSNQTFRWYTTTVTVVSGQSVANINFALPITAAVSGRVTEADGVTPIENAGIFVTTQCGEVGSFFGTGADGTYNTTDGLPNGLPTGSYTIRASRSGYVEATVNAVPLTVGNLTPNINFTLDKGGTITGRVTTTQGSSPITVPINATVTLLNLDGTPVPNNGYIYYALAGVDGTYALTGLPTGNFIVQASHLDHAYQYYPNQALLSDAQLVTVTTNTTTPNIDFALNVSGTITGFIQDADGNGIYGYPVQVVTIDGEVVGQGTNPGTPSGNYTIKNLPPGTYYVRSGTINNYGLEYYPNQASAATASLVTVTAGATTPNINFNLDTVYGTLAGRFTVAGLPSEYFSSVFYPLHVTVTPTAGGSPVFEGTVDARYQPQYYVERILPGNYTVTIQGSNTLSVTKTEVTVSLSNPVTVIDMGFLRGGDVDGNNLVNITDFSILASGFNRVFCEPGFDARADFNRDNRINILDFSMLATYFGQSG